MPLRATKRYCADPDALATMARDGLGWGHDLDCGRSYDAFEIPRSGRLARILAFLKGSS